MCVVEVENNSSDTQDSNLSRILTNRWCKQIIISTEKPRTSNVTKLFLVTILYLCLK